VSDQTVALSNVNQNVPQSRTRGVYVKWKIRVLLYIKVKWKCCFNIVERGAANRMVKWKTGLSC
jgi:hypothetical protein